MNLSDSTFSKESSASDTTYSKSVTISQHIETLEWASTSWSNFAFYLSTLNHRAWRWLCWPSSPALHVNLPLLPLIHELVYSGINRDTPCGAEYRNGNRCILTDSHNGNSALVPLLLEKKKNGFTTISYPSELSFPMKEVEILSVSIRLPRPI